MKNTKRTLTLLLSALMLTSCLLPLAGCTGSTTTSNNPFEGAEITNAPDRNDDNQSGKVPDQSTDHSNGNDLGWTGEGIRGEKILYGKEGLYSGILRYGDMMISHTNFSNCVGYYAIDEPDSARFICFDPLCLHYKEDCPAVLNRYDSSGWNAPEYPSGMYLDLYENPDSPVIYFYYRRAEFYAINTEEGGQRDPVYCIERYDFSQGKRAVLLDNLENTIENACNYGDYVYYVLDESYVNEETAEVITKKTLNRIHKSGGSPESLDLEGNPFSITITDVIDERLYYIVDAQTLYSANLDLTDSKKELDLSTLKGENGSVGVYEGMYSGYLFYFADVETVWSGTPEDSTSDDKANLYRIPVRDLTQAPEKIVEGMIYNHSHYSFSEKTLYYQPCVYKWSENRLPESAQIDVSGGKLYAMDLETNESKLIVDEPGLVMYLKNAWDDIVTFSGTGCDTVLIHQEIGDGDHLSIAYASGEPYKIWCGAGAPGTIDEAVLEAHRAQSKLPS